MAAYRERSIFSHGKVDKCFKTEAWKWKLPMFAGLGCSSALNKRGEARAWLRREKKLMEAGKIPPATLCFSAESNQIVVNQPKERVHSPHVFLGVFCIPVFQMFQGAEAAQSLPYPPCPLPHCLQPAGWLEAGGTWFPLVQGGSLGGVRSFPASSSTPASCRPAGIVELAPAHPSALPTPPWKLSAGGGWVILWFLPCSPPSPMNHAGP